MDVNSFALQSAYTGQFTVQGNPVSTSAQAKNYSPLANSTNVPLNVRPQIMFDQAILAGSLNAATAYLNCNNATVAGSASVIGNGTIVQFTLTSALPASTSCYFQVNGAKNTSGLVIAGAPYFNFTTGTTRSHRYRHRPPGGRTERRHQLRHHRSIQQAGRSAIGHGKHHCHHRQRANGRAGV